MSVRVVPCLAILLLAARGAWADGPLPVSPGSGQRFLGTASPCPAFSWTAAPGAKRYELLVYAMPEPELGAQSAAGAPDLEAAPILRAAVPAGALSWTPASESCLALGGHFAWAVRAVGGRAVGEWSEPALFKVEPGPLLGRIGDVLEQVLSRYLEERGVELEPDGTLASLIAEELGEPSPVATPGAAPTAAVREVFFQGRRMPESEVAEILRQTRAAQGAPAPLIKSGGPGGTSSAVLLDEPELLIDDQFDSAGTFGMIAWKSESTFDWVWALNSAENGSAMFLLGGEIGLGDSIGFPASGGKANLNEAFVLNRLQLDPKVSGSRPICNSSAHEGSLYYDTTTNSLCACDGVSWKKVDGGAAC